MPVLSHSGLFSWICLVEVFLILRVLPHYIECHYYLPFLFSEDWLSHPSALSFPEGWHSQFYCFYYVDWLSLLNYLFTFPLIGIATQLLFNFLKVWHCHSIVVLSCGLALPPKLLTFTVDWQSHPNITCCNIPQVTHNPNNWY